MASPRRGAITPGRWCNAAGAFCQAARAACHLAGAVVCSPRRGHFRPGEAAPPEPCLWAKTTCAGAKRAPRWMHPPTASSKGGAHPGDRLGWAVVDGLVYPSARDVLEAQVRGDIPHNKEVQLFRLADLRKGPTWSHLRDTSIIDTATLSATSVSDAWKAWD